MYDFHTHTTFPDYLFYTVNIFQLVVYPPVRSFHICFPSIVIEYFIFSIDSVSCHHPLSTEIVVSEECIRYDDLFAIWTVVLSVNPPYDMIDRASTILADEE